MVDAHLSPFSRAFETASYTEPLVVLLSKVAFELEDMDLSVAHAKSALAHHKNEIKRMHARTILATGLCESFCGGDDGD